jgi:hypothetical protein
VKALTVRQPWASLLVMGVKRIETRPWRLREPQRLLIHAGTKMPCRIGQRVTFGAWEVERDSAGLLLRGPIAWPYRLPMGALIGSINVFEVRRTDSGECGPDDAERALGDYSPGRFAWSTNCPQPLPEPIPCKGRLTLWTPPDDVLAAVAGSSSTAAAPVTPPSEAAHDVAAQDPSKDTAAVHPRPGLCTACGITAVVCRALRGRCCDACTHGGAA